MNPATITPEAQRPVTAEVQTPGERERETLIESLQRFAVDTLTKFTDADFLPLTDSVDWENPKASLLQHPGVKKAIRVLASFAAQSQQWELRKFDCLWPQKYLDEIHAELPNCADGRTFNKLESKADAFVLFLEQCPATVAEYRSFAQTHRCNTAHAAATLINLCRKIVAAWLEAIPNGRARELVAELDRLTTASLAERLAWFGLSDFIPTGELPQFPAEQEATC